MPRNYRQEYDRYHASPEQKKNRAARNKARAEATKSGKVSKGDGKDVGHKIPLSKGGTNQPSNRRVQFRSKNRSQGGKIGNRKGKARGGRN